MKHQLFYIIFLSLFSNALFSQYDEKESVLNPDSIGSEKIYLEAEVDVPAQYTDDKESIFTYVYRHISYPAEARKNKIQGQVILSFIIEKSGEITNIQVVRSVHKTLDDAAIYIFDTMPNWAPARLNNEFVRSKVIFPIKFTLR